MEAIIEVTQYCEEECPYCSSNASKDGRPLSFKKIKEFLESQENLTIINISGGEPLSHPNIWKILKLCNSLVGAENVYLCSNAIRNLVYNANVVPRVFVAANVCVIPGETVTFPDNVDLIKVLKLVHQGRAKDLPRIATTASSNFQMKGCVNCETIVLQADGKIVNAPCKKEYPRESR